MDMDPEDINTFWFSNIGPGRWFSKDPALDEEIRSKFLAAYEKAAQENLPTWKETPEGALALLLLLDVFPRRMFRGAARAYETDDLALDLARESIIRHFDDRIDRVFKLFFYLPFSRVENLSDQRLGCFYVRERTKEPDWVAAVERRMAVVQQFGRFPHRNAALGRESTPEERVFLQQK